MGGSLLHEHLRGPRTAHQSEQGGASSGREVAHSHEVVKAGPKVDHVLRLAATGPKQTQGKQAKQTLRPRNLSPALRIKGGEGEGGGRERELGARNRQRARNEADSHQVPQRLDVAPLVVRGHRQPREERRQEEAKGFRVAAQRELTPTRPEQSQGQGNELMSTVHLRLELEKTRAQATKEPKNPKLQRAGIHQGQRKAEVAPGMSEKHRRNQATRRIQLLGLCEDGFEAPGDGNVARASKTQRKTEGSASCEVKPGREEVGVQALRRPSETSRELRIPPTMRLALHLLQIAFSDEASDQGTKLQQVRPDHLNLTHGLGEREFCKNVLCVRVEVKQTERNEGSRGCEIR